MSTPWPSIRISLRIALYRSLPFSANTQIILDFHLPPKTDSPYSKGHRISFSNLGLYTVHATFLDADFIIVAPFYPFKLLLK